VTATALGEQVLQSFIDCQKDDSLVASNDSSTAAGLFWRYQGAFQRNRSCSRYRWNTPTAENACHSEARP